MNKVPLKVIRLLRGLSQYELAAKARLNHATVSRVERGACRGNKDTREAIAGALGWNVDEILWPQDITDAS